MNKILIITLAVFVTLAAHAQKKRQSPPPRQSKQNQFLDKQWWLGFKAGTNFTDAIPVKRYTSLTPTNYPVQQTNKIYDAYAKAGMQASLEATFYIKGFSFSIQPTYRNTWFEYSNQFEWYNPENAAERLTLLYSQEQKIDYADFPFYVKYDILKGNLRPYVQIGIFYSFLLNANKSVTISGTDYASGGMNQFSNEPIIVGAKDLYTNYWGLAGGAGLNYHVGNVRLTLDASFWKGMSNVTKINNRYGNDRLSGIGDVQDDLNLNNLIISIGVLFPLRFLSNSFNTLDR
jgi:outer membrane protein W